LLSQVWRQGRQEGLAEVGAIALAADFSGRGCVGVGSQEPGPAEGLLAGGEDVAGAICHAASRAGGVVVAALAVDQGGQGGVAVPVTWAAAFP